MVDTTDLKSVIRNGCEGSNPSSATYTRVAHRKSAARLYKVGNRRSTHRSNRGKSPLPELVAMGSKAETLMQSGSMDEAEVGGSIPPPGSKKEK